LREFRFADMEEIAKEFCLSVKRLMAKHS